MLSQYGLRVAAGAGLRLLECEFYAAMESFAAGSLTGGRQKVECDIAASGELNGVHSIRSHEEISITISELRFQSGEELLFAAIPGDNDFSPRNLPAIRIQHQDLKKPIREIGIANYFLSA